MKTVNRIYKIHMWMCTGHEFDVRIESCEHLSCEEIENFMHFEAVKRGFLNGINDIESYDVNLQFR